MKKTKRFCQCTFINELVEEGSDAVVSWFSERREDPTNDSKKPHDYNGWSEVAKFLGLAVDRSLRLNSPSDALHFGAVTCEIYEEILPLMQSELALLGRESIGIDMTKVEAMSLRVRLLNQLGPVEKPILLDIKNIESWFFNSLNALCPDSKEQMEKVFRENFNNSNDFQEMFRGNCIRTHVKVIQRINDQFLTNPLREWICAFNNSDK